MLQENGTEECNALPWREIARTIYQNNGFLSLCVSNKSVSQPVYLPGPEWGSCSLGVFICLGCSGIHRNIPDIGKVKSLTLSRWEDSEVQVGCTDDSLVSEVETSKLAWCFPGDFFNHHPKVEKDIVLCEDNTIPWHACREPSFRSLSTCTKLLV